MSESDYRIRLEFRDVEYVAAIADEQSFSRAAEKLHVTQPALSIYIRNLEKRLGLPLFSRVGKNVFLTFSGQCFLDSGKQILLLRDNIQRQLNDIKRNQQGLLRVGFTPTRGIFFLPVMLNAFRECYPKVEFRYYERAAQQLESQLLRGELDIAFLNQYSVNSKITYHEIVSDPTVLFVSAELARKLHTREREGFLHPWVDLKELAEIPFIRNYPEQNTEQMTQRIFMDFNILPPVAAQISNQLTALNLAAYGYGVYMAVEYFVYNVYFDIRPVILSFGQSQYQYAQRFVAATASEAYCSTLAKEFIALAREKYTYKEYPHSSV